MNKIRIITFFVFLVIFTVIFQLGSMSIVSQEEASLFMNEFETLCLTHSLTQKITPFSYQRIQFGLIKSALD